MENWLYLGIKFSDFILRPDLERLLNSLKMFKTRKHDLRIIKWFTVAPESTEGEKSPTEVKCFIRRKSNLDILMTIYGFWKVIG
jgi:hypothetical protein